MIEFYLTKKKRRLEGKRLETFDKFWDIFNYKKGRADAADAWLDIPTLTDTIVADILLGAKAEAMRRQRLIDAGRTPKMAQGWITARRWEDDLGQSEIRPKIQCPNDYNNMVRAFNILCNLGEEKFHEFCKGVKLPPGDKEAAWRKYNLSLDAKTITKGMLKDIPEKPKTYQGPRPEL